MPRRLASDSVNRTARSSPTLPPSTRPMLSKERLPQTEHTSPALSLMTSQSAHNTAFCKGTVFRLDSGFAPASIIPFGCCLQVQP